MTKMINDYLFKRCPNAMAVGSNVVYTSPNCKYCEMVLGTLVVTKKKCKSCGGYKNVAL